MKIFLIWTVAFILTVATAVYQRVTGPTYPISGETTFQEQLINYKFYRSHGGETGHDVSIAIPDTSINATLYWKRYKTNDEWNEQEMLRNGDYLHSMLPHQPPAGKLEYYVKIFSGENGKIIPGESAVIIRFKGDVPMGVLIPHVIVMFAAMLFSTRTGLEYFSSKNNTKNLTIITLLLLIVGGFILGPIMQKYAFGEYWTGFPFGHDLTDNKTLIAFLGWLGALFMYGRSQKPKIWAAIAAILLMIVYLIPHSVLGSELDYNKMEKTKTEKIITDGDL